MSVPKKKYFVKDESLHSSDGDMFNYADISKVLNDIIVTNEPPYNIAVIGKWGLGKSSLINLVTERYKKDTDNYFIQEINAWKYEKESLRRVFLKQLWQGLSSKKIYSFEVVRREISNIIKENIGTIPCEGKGKRTKQFILTSLILCLFTLIAFAGYKCLQAFLTGVQIWSWTFWGHALLRYCKNIGTVLFIPVIVALFKVLIDDFHEKQSNKIELSFPIETTDDYEIFLETKIKSCLKNNPNLKIITIIDDLDRLSIDKIVEALDALKAFVGFDRCVFIVPFDDEIIKQALDKRKAQEFDGRVDVIESELILDKLFQFKIYLPPILDFDIRGYAVELAKQEITDFMKDYCDEALMQKAIERIIIHPNVSTPRQVKKLLNAFVNNYMIISARESSGKIQSGLLTSEEGTMQIAKISVLQADFNSFYDLLFLDMRCLEKMLSFHRNDPNAGSIPHYLRDYFITKDNQYTVKREYEPLINFLIKTEKYKVPSIAPFLYLAQDDISIKTGDELQRRAVNALISGNVNTLKKLLQESENIAEVIKYYLSVESDELSTAISTAIEAFQSISDSYKSSVATVIIERTIEFSPNDCQFLYSVSAFNVFNIAELGDNQSFASGFVNYFICVFAREDWLRKDYLLQSLPLIIQHWSELTPQAKSSLKAVTDLCVKSDSISAHDLLPCIDAQRSNEYMSLWALPWLQKLCSYIDVENDFSQEIIESLSKGFQELKMHIRLDELIAPIQNLAKYAAMLPAIADILNQPFADGSIKSYLPKDTATEFAISIIAYDFKKNESVICNILEGLPYVIDEDNYAEFDAFTLHFRESDLMDDVLVYCGTHGFFPRLTQTIESLMNDIFEDEENDTLLEKISEYLSDEQKLQLFQKLAAATVFNSNKDYSRELSLIKIVSIQKYEDELDTLMSKTWIPHFGSRFTNENYYDFVVRAISLTRDFVCQKTIDSFVEIVLSNFSSYPKKSLYAINQVSLKMSPDEFKKVFAKITSTTPASEFDLALDVITNNEDIRPRESADLTAYRNFLVKNIPTTSNPSQVLNVINRSFSQIPQLEEMVQNALKNQACNFDTLKNVIGKFLNNSESAELAADTIINICMLEKLGDIVVQSFFKINRLNPSDIFQQLTIKIEDTSTATVISNLIKLACNNLHIEAASQLLIRCLEISFSQVNQTENSIEYVHIIRSHATQLSKVSKSFLPILKSGFTSTTSDNLKKAILELVRALKIKGPFKKELTGDDLDFYNKEVN